jgi:hypothetical protein
MEATTDTPTSACQAKRSTPRRVDSPAAWKPFSVASRRVTIARSTPPPGDVDEVYRYIREAESPEPDDEYTMVTYAHHAYVVVLHVLGVARHDKYSVDQRDQLAAVVIDKLAELGRVEVQTG